MSLCSIAEDSLLKLPSLPKLPSHYLLIETKQLLPVTSALFLERPPPSLSHLEEEASIQLDIKSQEEKEVAPAGTKKRKAGCNCRKTKCLKLYCECFAQGKACTSECNCTGCHNDDLDSEKVQRAQEAIRVKMNGKKRRQGGCRCSKTKCQKKYCQCFNAGMACTEACRCEDCENGPCDTHEHSPSPITPQSQSMQKEEPFQEFKPFESISKLLE